MCTLRSFAAFLCLVLGAGETLAGPRSSSSYQVAAETVDAGGKPAASASYSNVGSLGGVAAVSTAAAPAVVVKPGFVGQLYEPAGLVITAAPATLNETTARQLAASQLLDDATQLPVPATSVAWSVVSGPINSISTAGLATAGSVYETTLATVQGTNGGSSGMLVLTVNESIPDNFGSYAGDSIGDDWQVLYFGINSPNAGPSVDFSGNGHTNLFKYIAGLNPVDPASRFNLRIEPVTGQPGEKKLIFHPVVSGRTYVVKGATSLALPTDWTAINAAPPSDSGNVRTVIDLSAGGERKFYRIEITKP